MGREKSKWYEDSGVFAYKIGDRLSLPNSREPGRTWVVSMHLTGDPIDGDKYMLEDSDTSGWQELPKGYVEYPNNALFVSHLALEP